MNNPLVRLIRSNKPYKESPKEYRRFVKNHYNGLAGWFTVINGFFTGHESLAKKIFNPQTLDLHGCKRILDAGCGNGRYLKALQSYADPDATLVGVDYSLGMLRRARRRLGSRPAHLAAADLTNLPFPARSFDAVVCGWVLEHLTEPALGLRELARVTKPTGKILLLATEDTIAGALCSRLYHCKTYSRGELKSLCSACGLKWHREHWWSGFHKLLKLGGIIVELRLPLPRLCNRDSLRPGLR